MKLKSFRWLAAGAVLSVIGAGASQFVPDPATAGTPIHWVTDSQATVAADHVTSSKDYAHSLSGAFRSASGKVLPSVVTIQSSARHSQSVGSSSGGQLPEELRNNPLFRRFFEDLPQGGSTLPQMPQRTGMGSGVIVDPSGIILTNHHVVKGADSLLVKLHDGRQFEATEWKTDPKTDIAVVRIESSGSLPAAAIGDSDQMDVGDWVMAVGAPFGLNETVTAGIISAKARGIGISAREDFLQTDAAINPGNSGGPLINLQGEVVGINTAISSTNGGYQGIGFAVPINVARWVSDELMSHGSVRRAFLGVGVQTIDNALSEQFGLNTVSGAVVTHVRNGSPAAKAGVQSGDVVLEFDGMAIRKPADLQAFVERASLTDSHKLVIVRNGTNMTLNVNVEAMPVSLTDAENSAPEPAEATEFSDLGIQISDLTDEVAKQLGMEDASGVVITNVKPGSPAQSAGLQDGMVIQKVGQTAVQSADEFRSAMAAQSLNDGVLLLVRSGDATRFVVVKG